MSAIHTWACFLLWINFATQDKTPDVAVTCFVSENCMLPCNFQPASKETIEWFRQDVAVYKFERDNADHNDDTDDDDNDNDDSDSDSHSSEEQYEQDEMDSRAFVSPKLIARGNATLTLKGISLKDRGAYRCHVRTSQGEHNAKVIVKVEAPIRGLSVELSRLSGYEEMKCIVRNVFPAPHVTWATEPATFEELKPVTRKLADKQGLYTVDSRLRRLNGQPDLIYICKVTTPYGGPTWSASLREREIRGIQGKDLTIPCSAPSYLHNPFLHWTFSNGQDSTNILTYDSQSGNSFSKPPWENHVEVDGFRVPFGDGSLRLMDPKHLEHTGSYTCVFSMLYNTHTERSDVSIDNGGERRTSEMTSYWWVVGLVIAVLVLSLATMLIYLKFKGSNPKPRKDPEDVTELHLVKDSTASSNQYESSPLTVDGTSGQRGLESGT